jgi:hypothetical protein
MIDVFQARALWGELHSHSSKSNHDQVLFLSSWLKRVREILTCSTCYAKVERFKNLYQPDYGEGFHFWGVCLHDFVNRELGRPLHRPDLTIPVLTSKGIFQ